MDTEPISLDLTVKRFLLTTEVTLTAGDGTEAADLARYLNVSNNEAWLEIAAGTGLDTDAFTLSAAGTVRRTTSLFYTGAASALTCTLSAPPFGTLTGSAVPSDGNWTVSFTSMLYPGVVAQLSAVQTMSACYAFYGADDAFLSRSSTFHLYTLAQDYAAECPVGTAKVVLVPGIYSGQLSDTTYAGVTGKGWALKTWDVSMTQGRIVALEAFAADETVSMNAVYATQPNSSLTPGADSFISEQDLIRFTGSIGLDAGMQDGRIEQLIIYPGSDQSNKYYTAEVRSVSIGGKSYPAGPITAGGYYSFAFPDFPDGIPLPCDFTIFCTPGSLSWDMELTVTADVRWADGSASSQLIGSAVVSRPGACIQTLSTYVNQSAIQVSGVARPVEDVTIYDGGAVIGTAKGDQWGEWTAMVTLAGTDESVPTVHRLYAVSASGAVSDVLTVLHDAKGPQLTKFTMSWADYSGGDMTTINIGDAYIYRGGMYDTTFAATFTKPGALNTMEAWGCKAVFKVFTNDGEIRFLEASQSGGVFTARAPETLRAPVTRAEVLYEPALHTGFHLSNMQGAAPAAFSAKMKAVAAEVKADTSVYPSYVYALTYDRTGKASAEALGGTTADRDFVNNLVESAGKYPDKGLVISYVTSDDHYTTPTEEWLRLTAVDASIQNWYALRIGKYASECRMYTLSRHYIGGRDSAGILSAAEAFEREKAYFEGLETVHSVFTLDGGRYDLYTIETEGTDADGAPYLDRYVTAAFAAVDGVYTSSFTVTYSDRVCLKLVREKLDEMYPQTGASAAQVRTAAVGAGAANAVLRNAAAGAPIRLTDEGQTYRTATR